MNLQEINIDSIKIVENVRLVLKNIPELMQDIKKRGLRLPIEVAKTKSKDYVLISGNRRLEACTKLGWKKIPALVCEDMEMAQLLINNAGENIHREDISPQEFGRICDRLRKFGLNNSEIAASLSVQVARVNQALEIYFNLPDRFRKNVAYMGKGGKRDGSISASVASKIISIKKSHGLSDPATEKLLNTTKMEELGMAELSLVGLFLDQEFSVTQAIDMAKEYKSIRTDVYVHNKEMDELLFEHKMDSSVMILQSIIYGEIPPLKRPNFVRARQIPSKRANGPVITKRDNDKLSR